MARKFSELRAKMSAESQARAKARTYEMLQEMALAELRRARQLTQQKLASTLKVNQAWISKVERQTDMYLSTLRAYVEAIGGQLEIIARFDDYGVRINQLKELDPQQELFRSGKASSNEIAASSSERENTRLSVWTQQPPETTATGDAERHPRIWKPAEGSPTRTTKTNTTSPTSKAA